MKKLLIAAVFVLTAAGAQASNYPADYCQQHVRVATNGPALLAVVGSGCMGKDVLGYKKSGILGNAYSVEAVIRTECGEGYSGGYNTTTVETRLTLTREWNGNGFLSYSLEPSFFCGNGSNYIRKMEISFNANGQSDGNHVITYDDIYKGDSIKTNDFGGDIGTESWAVIVDQMRK
ncbi:MAG: hypothetical protein NTY45_08365 [Elusimicrobia bacterium]|nr:hypothetical protein [Elusimicrobiota bacterium]